jgi:glucose-6-phosphate isomerase
MSITFQSLDPKKVPLDRDHSQSAWAYFKKVIDHPDHGFFHLADQPELLSSCEQILERFKEKKNFIQVGIGGSALGPEMLVSSLGSSERRFEFLCNIDPDSIHDQLQGLEAKETLYYFVSKSGGTAETMAIFSIVSRLLISQGVSPDQFKDYMVFATDPTKSDLLNLGRELGVTCLSVPSNIGGRFSVLSPVGLLPALFAGIDGQKLLEGARAQKDNILNESCPLLSLGEFIFTHYKQGINQTVMMPYSSKMRDFSAWFVQLWAESLGKENKGLTPIASYGATDQHSQVQLFMEGPHDKLICFIKIKKFKNDLDLTNEFTTPSLKKLAPYRLSQLMDAELAGTQKAFNDQGRPSLTIEIDSLDAYHLGQLVLFFESLTALMGGFLEVDPFNQPGVEAGKKYAFEWLASL